MIFIHVMIFTCSTLGPAVSTCTVVVKVVFARMYVLALILAHSYTHAHTHTHTHTHTLTHTEEMDQVKSQATQYAKTMNLSVVRLCFQAFLIDGQGKFTIPVDPVFSQKVYDSSKSGVVCMVGHLGGSVLCV